MKSPVYECLFGKWHELVSKIGWQKISAMTNASSMLKCEPDHSSGTAKSKGENQESRFPASSWCNRLLFTTVNTG